MKNTNFYISTLFLASFILGNAASANTCDLSEVIQKKLAEEWRTYDCQTFDLGKKGEDIYQLNFENITIDKFKPNDFIGFKNLVRIAISNSDIGEIDGAIFKEVPLLKILDIRDTVIRKGIPQDLTKNIPNLVDLSLVNVGLTEITPGFFSNNKNIEIVELEKNKIKSISAGVFNGFNVLESLTFHANEITSVETGSFADLPSLDRGSISLYNNKINYSDFPADIKKLYDDQIIENF